MRVELLVYFYLAVCVAMILFNIATILAARLQERLSRLREARFQDLIADEVGRIKCDEPVKPQRLERLRRTLRNPEQLLVFVQVVRKQYEAAPDEVRQCLLRWYPALRALIPRYERENAPIHYAFFLYTVKEFSLIIGITSGEVGQVLLRALSVPNTYCRENALQAIYSSGQTELVIQALRLMDSRGIVHNKKLLCDGLLRFRGSMVKLAQRLWDVFESLNVPMQGVVLDFMRFSGCGDREHMFAILADEQRNPELRFACIRYFAKYSDPEAHPVLLDLAQLREEQRWEYAAIACSALASYPGEETVGVLKEALHVRSWYVRYNAAESLARLGISCADLMEVIDGEDRYAREILQYQLDMRYNQRREVTGE